MYSIITFDNNNIVLFLRLVRNKAHGKKLIINHSMLAHIDHVMYKYKNYDIKDIYKWK